VFGVVDPKQPAATALVASIATPFLTANQHRVDPVTRLIFFRAASAAAQNLITVLNPATNQIVGTLSFTSINAFAIDSLRSRLFVAAAGQLLLIDASPVSSTFLQTLFALPLGAAGAINAVADPRVFQLGAKAYF